ncbi:MAG: hypothetical protein JNM21_14735 [Taibaiella sp.]|nr:hypothetical protein [Taibaiella sp.]
MAIGINQTVSPIKFCFLIEPNSEMKFDRAIKLAFSIWGGIFSPILPLYSELPHKYKKEYDVEVDTYTYYKNTLDNFDPDVVLYDQGLDDKFIKTFIGDRTLLTSEEFQNDLEKDELRYGISILEIMSNIINTEFKYVRNDDLKLSIPILECSNIFLKSFIGCFIDNLQSKIVNELNERTYFEQPEINYNNINNYFPRENISTIDINLQEIITYNERRWLNEGGIYFLNETRLNDIINFWNLRALGWNIIPIPISQIDNEYFTGLIERFCKSQLAESEYPSFINVLSNFINDVFITKDIERKLYEIKNKIEGNFHFIFRDWFPRFWAGDRSILDADNALCEKTQITATYSQVELQDNNVKFKAENIPFKLNNDFNLIASHKINLTFSYSDKYLKDAGLVYGIDTIDWTKLTQSFDFGKWRLSRAGTNYYVRGENDEVYFCIPKAEDFFKVFFLKSGNRLNQTSSGRLANEVLKNMGGIYGFYILKNKSLLKIFDLIEDGKTVSHAKIVGEIKASLRTNKNERINSYIQTLIENKIIEFGSILQCEICHQHSFYLLSELKEIMNCAACRNNFNLPMHHPSAIKWGYRGIGPFSKNNKVGGILAVFLTIKILYKEFSQLWGNISTLIGFELIKNKKTKEIDLAIMLQEKNKENITPDLFFCECKTYNNFTKVDADRMIEIGTEFPNSILTFATLNDELTENEKNEILRVVNHFRTGIGNRPTNPVFILTAKELLPNDFSRPFLEYEKDAKLYTHADRIGNLCDLSVRKHLNIRSWQELRNELFEELKNQHKKKKEN